MELSEDLLSKVSRAANDSFTGAEDSFKTMKPEEVIRTAYMNGYNCSYNIYDVAEEKIEAFRKDGEVPEQDIPDISVSSTDKAQEYLRSNGSSNLSGSIKDNYVRAYQSGFSDAWNEFINAPMNRKLEDIVDYYLTGKK